MTIEPTNVSEGLRELLDRFESAVRVNEDMHIAGGREDMIERVLSNASVKERRDAILTTLSPPLPSPGVERLREALAEASEAIGVCITGFEKSNPTLGGLAAIHMLKDARERYRALSTLSLDGGLK